MIMPIAPSLIVLMLNTGKPSFKVTFEGSTLSSALRHQEQNLLRKKGFHDLMVLSLNVPMQGLRSCQPHER